MYPRIDGTKGVGKPSPPIVPSQPAHARFQPLLSRTGSRVLHLSVAGEVEKSVALFSRPQPKQKFAASLLGLIVTFEVNRGDSPDLGSGQRQRVWRGDLGPTSSCSSTTHACGGFLLSHVLLPMSCSANSLTRPHCCSWSRLCNFFKTQRECVRQAGTPSDTDSGLAGQCFIRWRGLTQA